MISEDSGRLFEVGFNIGSLAYIQKQNISHNFGEFYRHELQQLSFPKMVKELIREANLIGSLDSKIIEKWSLYFLQKGFLSGFNFLREYIHSTGWKPEKLKIVYYQCSFAYVNSIRTYERSEDQVFREVLLQLTSLQEAFSPDQIESYIRRYKKMGEFLQSDLLMLLQHGQKFRILCVDLSVFSPNNSTSGTMNLGEVEVMRNLLIKEINYLRSKSVFSNLRIDTSNLEIDFSENLQRYFTAFKYKDKESTKLIQAASYAHSFYGFLQEKSLIPSKAEVFFNVVGYSDRGISAISLRQNQLNFLATCSQIYKDKPKNKDINEVRREVLNHIQRQAAYSFQDGRNFIDRLSAITKDTTLPISHTERLDRFCNSVDIISDELAEKLHLTPGLNFREAHAQLIIKSLTSANIYIFLTGNPGIGKTTAIANFLKQHMDDGFLLFYVSPRKQVNLDIIEKFKNQETGLLCDDRLFCLNTNSDIITSNSGRCTVKYSANSRQDNFTQKTVKFLSDRSPVKHQESHQPQITRKGETTLQSNPVKTRGVLDSICEAIYTLIDSQISNNIVATASIQSLKITGHGRNTLAHFEKIFQDTLNKRNNQIIPAKMQAISSRIKHLFIMIDEITGDDSGVEFLNGIDRIVKHYQLTQHGFNIKVIVADASIVDPDVIQQHLEDPSPEPDKIYFKKLADNCEEIPPLQVTPIEFKRLAATVINANSYPARSLELTYKVFVETVKFSENTTLTQKHSLVKLVQSEIVQDINERLAKPGVEQLIVYVQDKRRLAELIEKIQNQRKFQPYQDYLEIHANISEEEKEKIQQYKNQVKVVFMTASGSRGLSFPKTKHILVDIPRFQIEKNLMELIQVIYRGRGEDEQGKTLDYEDKELVFYLSEKAFYYEDDCEVSLQESKLNILNILLILKTSIMTRIIGYGDLGRKKFLMIPIGGKSVSAAGDTFTNQMANLIKELKSEHRRQRADKSLEEVYTSLEKLFSHAEFILRNTHKSHTANESYLKLLENFNKNFIQRCDRLDGLLNYGNIEIGHINGSLLVVPMTEQTLEEFYQMQLYPQIKKYVNDELLQKMRKIAHSKSYPENLQTAIKGGAMELVKLLKGEIEKTQYFEQESQCSDRYYALPFFTFINGEEMSKYFAGKPEEAEDEQFRDILSTYVRSLYPVGSVLPIGYQYQEFPFVVFRCYSLEKRREKIFSDRYLLTSNELNILNLILSKST